MKIYNSIRLDIDTFEVIEEDSFHYDGEIAECSGGGGSQTTVTVDYAYNARMAAIAEKQQAQADQYFKEWETTYKPYERAQVDANMELMPFEIDAQKETLKGISELAPLETGLRKEQISSEMDMIPKRNAVSSKFYEEALSGIDVQGRMNTASADVSQALAGSEAAARREASRMGLNASSGRMAEMLKTSSLDRAKAVGTARTTARTGAEQEQFGRLTAAQNSVIQERRGIT